MRQIIIIQTDEHPSSPNFKAIKEYINESIEKGVLVLGNDIKVQIVKLSD